MSWRLEPPFSLEAAVERVGSTVHLDTSLSLGFAAVERVGATVRLDDTSLEVAFERVGATVHLDDTSLESVWTFDPTTTGHCVSVVIFAGVIGIESWRVKGGHPDATQRQQCQITWFECPGTSGRSRERIRLSKLFILEGGLGATEQ